MTNHTNTNNSSRFMSFSALNHSETCRKHNQQQACSLNLDLSATTTTNSSYYSPQSQCQSQMSSLSPLSINSLPSSKSMKTNNGKCFHAYVNYRQYHFTDKQSAKFSLQVFVAMHTTRQLAWYTNHEAWGDKNSLLFKYLDYTFRCAAFRDQVYTFDEKLYFEREKKSRSFAFPSKEDESIDNCNNNESRLVFNTGLVARQSGRTIYLILTPNQKKSVAQQWRVCYGDPYNRYNSSFVTDEWLLNNVIPNKNRDLLPKQFKLNTDLFHQIKHKFKSNKLQIEADFDHIVTKYWDRIIAEYNKRSASINVPSKEETTKLLKKAFDSVRRDKKKHKLLTPMLYVDSHNTQHSVEYMVPLPINVAIRDNSRHHNHRSKSYAYKTETIWFAAALVSRERNHAQLMSILSADMAYSNARLIGAVTTSWLKKLAPLYHKLEAQLSHKISSVLKVYHINQEDDDNIERFLYSTFSKYGKILSVDISLISSPNENDLNPSDEFSAAVRFVNSHSVIEAYNGCMDALNRGHKLGFELDFELIKEIEERESLKHVHLNDNNAVKSHYLCQFSMIFSRPHILPPPEQLPQLLSIANNNNNIGPFYPIHRIKYHECAHCQTKSVIDNVSHKQRVSETSTVIVHHPNYRILYKSDNEYNVLRDLLRSHGINASYIKYIKRCVDLHHGTDKKLVHIDKKGTTATTLWYQTSPKLAAQIAFNGFIFKFMTDFSKLMNTSGFKFETNPRVNNASCSIMNEAHLFQCKLHLTDKQLGYLRHNANIIITDTRIIKPMYWIVLGQKIVKYN